MMKQMKLATVMPALVCRSSNRMAGTTLSEVLVSLLVMSIGVVSLASLFPISVIRSVQATKLTNAAMLKYNAESLARVLPNLISIAPEWSEGTAYVLGDVRVAKVETRRKTPAAAFLCTTAGTSGSLEPTWNFKELGTTSETPPPVPPPPPVQWQTFRLKNYIVDPLGFLITDPSDPDSKYRGTALLGTKEHFGNVTDSSSNLAPFSSIVNRFVGVNLGLVPVANRETTATQLATLPDSWVELSDSREPVENPLIGFNLAVGDNITSVTLEGVSDTLNVPPASLLPIAPFTRVVIWDQNGKNSVVRYLTAATATNPPTVTWTDPIVVTDTFRPSRVRVEQLERRYTWLLSVRRGAGGSAQVNCVVSFRRPLTTADERVWPAVFRKIDYGLNGVPGGPNNDDDPSGARTPVIVNWVTPPAGGAPFNEVADKAELGYRGTDDQPRNWVVIQFNKATDEPYIKKGGFVCDAVNLHWYRIIDTDGPHTTMASATPSGCFTGLDDDAMSSAPASDRQYVRLTLERPIQEDSFYRTSDAPGVTFPGGAILMRGVVDVFPLKTQLPWEE